MFFISAISWEACPKEWGGWKEIKLSKIMSKTMKKTNKKKLKFFLTTNYAGIFFPEWRI